MVRITSKLNTSRLSLRPLASEDFPSLIELLSDFEVSRALRQVPHPYTQQDAEDFLRITIEGREANALDDYAITRHHDGSFIGGIGLRYNDERTRADFGYWIARKHWGCGYATEAVRAVIDFAFSERARHKQALQQHQAVRRGLAGARGGADQKVLAAQRKRDGLRLHQRGPRVALTGHRLLEAGVKPQGVPPALFVEV